jgi:hypothetical protein
VELKLNGTHQLLVYAGDTNRMYVRLQNFFVL